VELVQNGTDRACEIDAIRIEVASWFHMYLLEVHVAFYSLEQLSVFVMQCSPIRLHYTVHLFVHPSVLCPPYNLKMEEA